MQAAINAGADLEARHEGGWTPLLLAAAERLRDDLADFVRAKVSELEDAV